MKFANILTFVALATGAVQALPAPDANADANELMARDAKGASSTITKQLKSVNQILNTLGSTISSGVTDVSTLLGLVSTATTTLQGLL